MRIHRHRRGQPKFAIPQFKVNEQIKSPEVRLVSDDFIGVLPTSEAIAKAREQGMDLIEVSPKAEPPVCKVMEYGTFKYQKEKEIKKQRAQSKEVELKGIRLSFRIGENDMQVRANQAKAFFEKGHKVKIEMQLRGREREHKDRACQIINNFIDMMRKDFKVRVESEIQMQNGRLQAIIAPQ
ncbi:MAG: Translation initiation factor IF-3 [Candidatus Uhrbacteria bacterium GW2011_GWD2_41_121]|uniref:Translation initiation factor IF-3 n=1 Tax=Candidatus Uhrbacteria bacterium GW2011_GWC1_41_20 TaxID=1618983 RepID=A0A0G0YFX2_9BACT|nr:MAG: Translation initiation factor IF-3 [Candidatus Uhrbacteria bacterium GW2011_GWE1_39_46]KKR63940.1 MAG: Translation initiation factor IF-3 [Candidatus Uhrbacteria bacterium GW2011_GWC2_40_450]KKR90148.1 MAG: Translation initiation factor IF-3 [Candidatus Uhrbacteria bacterium GW2011_GWD2_41_121]KKR94307.1 MAG: Translation initiation factor IF-3 [Candidatus Uhrbacteria bacterium GW2011_GWD1_41_16]KKR99232.1 MAG: bacterial translation initiation factor 3 (bIF-3) [Candidatus Uhrbacteria bac